MGEGDCFQPKAVFLFVACGLVTFLALLTLIDWRPFIGRRKCSTWFWSLFWPLRFRGALKLSTTRVPYKWPRKHRCPTNREKAPDHLLAPTQPVESSLLINVQRWAITQIIISGELGLGSACQREPIARQNNINEWRCINSFAGLGLPQTVPLPTTGLCSHADLVAIAQVGVYCATQVPTISYLPVQYVAAILATKSASLGIWQDTILRSLWQSWLVDGPELCYTVNSPVKHRNHSTHLFNRIQVSVYVVCSLSSAISQEI